MIDPQVIAQAKKQLVDQNKEKVLEIANQVIADGGDPLELMDRAFIPGINEVGDLFGRGQLFLPELMVAADAYAEDAQDGVTKVKELLSGK